MQLAQLALEALTDAYGDGGETRGDRFAIETFSGRNPRRNGDAGVAGRPGRGVRLTPEDLDGGESGGRALLVAELIHQLIGERTRRHRRDAAKHGVRVSTGADRLFELFGGKSLKSFPGGIDQDTYAKANILRKAFSEFKAGRPVDQGILRFAAATSVPVSKAVCRVLRAGEAGELANASTRQACRAIRDPTYENLEKAKPETANGELTDSVSSRIPTGRQSAKRQALTPGDWSKRRWPPSRP